MKQDKKLMQLEFTEGWTQAEIPELTKLCEPAVTMNTCTHSLSGKLKLARKLESFLRRLPHGPSSGQLSPHIKAWGPRGQVCSGIKLRPQAQTGTTWVREEWRWWPISSAISSLGKPEPTPRARVRLAYLHAVHILLGQAAAAAVKSCLVWEGMPGREGIKGFSVVFCKTQKALCKCRLHVGCEILTVVD